MENELKYFNAEEMAFIINANTEGIESAKDNLNISIGATVRKQLAELPENDAKADYIDKTTRAQCEVFCSTLNAKLNTFKGNVLWKGKTGTAKKAEVANG